MAEMDLNAFENSYTIIVFFRGRRQIIAIKLPSNAIYYRRTSLHSRKTLTDNLEILPWLQEAADQWLLYFIRSDNGLRTEYQWLCV